MSNKTGMWAGYVPPANDEEAAKTQTNTGGGYVDHVFAEGTRVLAQLAGIAWKSSDYEENYINARWRVLEPAAVKGATIWSKNRVYGTPSQSKRAMDQLWVLGVYAKTDVVQQAFAAGEEISDADLAQLVGTTAVLNLSMWCTDEEDLARGKEPRSGNWVRGILDASSTVTEDPVLVDEYGKDITDESPRPSAAPQGGGFDDDEIPF